MMNPVRRDELVGELPRGEPHFQFCTPRFWKRQANNKVNTKFIITPVKNVTWISSSLFDGSLVENPTKSDGNPPIF